MKKSLVALAIVATFSSGAYAFGLPSIPGVTSSSSSAPAGNAQQLVKDADAAINQFWNAEVKIAQALGVYKEFAASNELVGKLKTGDAAGAKDDQDTKITVSKELGDVISKKMAENAPLDVKQKKLAGEGTLEYVKALLSMSKLVGGIQALAKNPTSIGLDFVGPITKLASNMPGLVTNGVSSTGTIINYMSTNGVDVSKAKKAADDLGK